MTTRDGGGGVEESRVMTKEVHDTCVANFIQTLGIDFSCQMMNKTTQSWLPWGFLGPSLTMSTEMSTSQKAVLDELFFKNLNIKIFFKISKQTLPNFVFKFLTLKFNIKHSYFPLVSFYSLLGTYSNFLNSSLFYNIPVIFLYTIQLIIIATKSVQIKVCIIL